MRLSPAEIARYLCCPDDGSSLAVGSNSLRCSSCSRQFTFHGPNLLEILPSKPLEMPASEVPAQYRDGYVRHYSQGCEIGDDALPFGAPEASSSKARRRRQRQTEEVLHCLGESSENVYRIFCDLSAGAGHTTFAAAPRSLLVFHCDLSVAAVRYAAARATRLGVENIMAIRADYFHPPFRNCIDRLTCLDSLIRGPWHELKLLAAIRQALTVGGVAMLDFHNWWHNPLRRLGLLRQNFGENRSYTQREVLELLQRAGIDDFSIHGFFQEADPRRWPMRIAKSFIPATRFMVRIPK